MDSRPPRQAIHVQTVIAPGGDDAPSGHAVAEARPPSAAPTAAARFRALFDSELTYVWTSLRRLGVPEGDREDLANEVFFRVYQRIDDYDPTRPARPWLFAFAVRVASEHRRRPRHRFEELGGAEDASVDAVAPPSPEDTELVYAALAELDLDRRAVLVLHDLDGHSVPDIAAALAIPEGTAYSRLRAARADFTTAVRRREKRER
jgi:RNA polymerase sigma-70 factor (ECF subfamily)